MDPLQSIPNLVVKHYCDDDTKEGALWESSSISGLYDLLYDYFKLFLFCHRWPNLAVCQYFLYLQTQEVQFVALN